MERCVPASLQKAEPLLSTAGRRRELGPRGQKPGRQITVSMTPELLKLPLGVKFPVPPNSKPVFTRAKLGEKLHRPSGYFNLRDPYSHLLGMEYNSLHDPHLQEYYHRKDNLEKLKREGRVTRDGQVVCTLKEFNEYRQYLTTLRQEAEQMSRQEEERIRQRLAQWKDVRKALGTSSASHLVEQLLYPPKRPAPSSKKPSSKSGRIRRRKTAPEKGQTYAQPESGQEGAELPIRLSHAADSEKQPELPAESTPKAAFEEQPAAELGQDDAELTIRLSHDAESEQQPELPAESTPKAAREEQTAAEARVEEVAEAVVKQVLERVMDPQNQLRFVLWRAALALRRRRCGSTGKAWLLQAAPLDEKLAVALVAKELVATTLETLKRKGLVSSMSEVGPGARQKGQRVSGGATQAGKSKEDKSGQTEMSAFDQVSSQASLDQLTREAVDHVCSTLESLVASDIEEDPSCTYAEILEFPRGNLSNRQAQPSQAPFSQPPLPDTSTASSSPWKHRNARGSIPGAISGVQQHRAEPTERARATVPEVLEAVRKKLLETEGQVKPKPTASSSSLAIRSMAKQIVESVLKRTSQPRPALPTELKPSSPLLTPPNTRKVSCASQDTIPSLSTQFFRQLTPPVALKPPAQAGVRQRRLSMKLMQGKSQDPPAE
ncbi:uncharacterized protein [Heliangelus exortis]|uniref:uncharacterized protein n=1 Tax=Heliangelus exortis TaxID=472823 RepID=UPI003A93F74C